jgi:hypothetical protein
MQLCPDLSTFRKRFTRAGKSTPLWYFERQPWPVVTIFVGIAANLLLRDQLWQ